MSRALRIGLSTCPNDTFLFHALLEGHVRAPFPLEFVLADVEELNRRLLAGTLDLAKASVPAMLARAERIWILPVGSALGYGVGPVLLAAPGRAPAVPLAADARVLLPGAHTTAALLFQAFAPELVAPGGPRRLEHALFSEVIAALRAGTADYGACIHEARFTWRAQGLGFVDDLGARYERLSGAPLPLGGLWVDRGLGADAAGALARTLEASLDWALARREATLPTLRRYAQEQADEVLWAHVDLYVNAATRELGPEGRAAYRALQGLAVERGLAPGTPLAFL
ncbi:MAG TPA: MqnA/MqnD/SBP family protein [Planctomycetota bacterium]